MILKVGKNGWVILLFLVFLEVCLVWRVLFLVFKFFLGIKWGLLEVYY